MHLNLKHVVGLPTNKGFCKNLTSRSMFDVVCMYSSLLREAPPSPPQNLHVTNVTSKSVTIEWETPDSNGGTEITSYIIEKLLTKSSQWSRVATLDSYCLSYCIDNLKETTELSFRVLAENAIGISAPAYTDSVVLKTHASTLNVLTLLSFAKLFL